ncbi:hypothetical protein [Acinetobacter baumannii]|uniref:hypothetical protein n=1 Tax=Acinetobacter baumannii TaxID=470 RepID=UPI000DE765AA|nr:hypothetical protein [Acinetobacter baumannii]ELT4633865.1 hypothetical protein [Acinetobacter baumannii]MBJ9443412.1 hypothetical protein [Acinetobacter baumannii]MDA5047506.1 hypothetical protein [Acinetobacter baumannii]MDX7904313.1 hypothetical protein [Acinetobacter baumannii]MDX7908278.1 hypothetical protein [Acinetobacter baumannii]
MEYKKFTLDDLDNIKVTEGVLLPAYFEVLKETIESYGNLKSFINKHYNIKKWLIISDYALDNYNKQGNFLTFTLMPCYMPINNLMGNIRKMQTKDIKKTKLINDDFIDFLAQPFFFHVSIELPYKRERLVKFGKDYFILLYTWLSDITSDKILKAQCKYFIEKLKRSPKLPLHTDIDFISCVVSLLQLQIFKHIPDTEVICWLSDRDDVLTTLGQKTKDKILPMIFNLINYRSQIFFNFLNLPLNKRQIPFLSFGLPETHGRMWYDSLIRIPDFIAGSLADNNKKEMRVTKKIFQEVLERVVSNKDHNLIIRLNIDENTVNFIKTIYELKIN